MKTNEKKDLQTKTVVELIKLITDAEKELIELKLSHEQSKLKDTSSIFTTRKKIAVLKTIVNAKKAVPADVAATDEKKTEKGGNK